jgi:hypothetical protein
MRWEARRDALPLAARISKASFREVKRMNEERLEAVSGDRERGSDDERGGRRPRSPMKPPPVLLTYTEGFTNVNPALLPKKVR